jgi:hypothetical protein
MMLFTFDLPCRFARGVQEWALPGDIEEAIQSER